MSTREGATLSYSVMTVDGKPRLQRLAADDARDCSRCQPSTRAAKFRLLNNAGGIWPSRFLCDVHAARYSPGGVRPASPPSPAAAAPAIWETTLSEEERQRIQTRVATLHDLDAHIAANGGSSLRIELRRYEATLRTLQGELEEMREAVLWVARAIEGQDGAIGPTEALYHARQLRAALSPKDGDPNE